MAREPRRIISAATELTGSGSPGGPGVSAPSPALERMEFLGRNLVSVSVLPLNTGGRIVIESGIKRVSPVQEAATVPWTAIGIPGLDGDLVVSLVAMEERNLELDSARNLCMEERTVLDQMKKPRSVTLTAVQWTVLGVLGGPGVSAPSPVLERMEFLEKNLVSVNALLLNTAERIVIQQGMKRLSPVQEMATYSLIVPKTETGLTGIPGEHAPSLAVEDQKLDLDSATILGMEERDVRETERRQLTATLSPVPRTATGILTSPGAAVANLAGEEHSPGNGLAFNQNMEANGAGERLWMRENATLTAVLYTVAGAPGVGGESVVRTLTGGKGSEPAPIQHRYMEAASVLETGWRRKIAMEKHDCVGTMTGNTEIKLRMAGGPTTTADIHTKHPGTRVVATTAPQQTVIATIWIVIMSTGINVIPLSGKLITIFVISNIFSNYFSQNQHSYMEALTYPCLIYISLK